MGAIEGASIGARSSEPFIDTHADTGEMRKRTFVAIMITLAAIGLAGLLGIAGLIGWRLWGRPSSALPDKPRVADVARELGCTDVTIAEQTRLYARESGSCTWNGSHVGIEVFAANSNRDQYVKVGSQFGGNIVTGDNWLVFTDSPDVAAAAAAKLGGKLL